MRKVVSIVSVCLVCLTLFLCMPVESHAMSFDDEPLRYSVLQFDYIETSFYKIPFPFNYVSASTYREPFEFGDLGIGGTVSMSPSGTYIDGYLNAVFDEVVLYSSLQVVRLTDLAKDWSYYLSPGTNGMLFTGADISFDVVKLSDNFFNSSNVGAAYDDISGFITSTSSGSILLGKGIYDLLADHGYSDNSRVLLSDLTVTLHYTIDSVDTASIWFASYYSNFHPDLLFGQWVSDQGIVIPDSPAVSSDFNLGIWLGDSVKTFLAFEIFPGFSIDKLFYCLLVIGVLGAFLKIFS